MYPDLSLYIDGRFIGLQGRASQPVRDPATLEVLGQLPWADAEDVQTAIESAQRAFQSWRHVSPVERSDI